MILLITLTGLLLLHFITGYGLVSLFRIKLNPLPKFALAVMVGILVASCVPFLLQLFYVPLTGKTIFLSWILVAFLLNLKALMSLRKGFQIDLRKALPKIRLYELPALLLITLVLFVSAWRCYYYPGYTRDGLSGPEPLAEYALREHTLINSVFSISLESTNNQFKSPYLTDLQLIYKLAGFPFGNVWLSLLVFSFFIFLYYSLSQKLHKVIAGLLLTFFLAIPEAYAYTFLCLYDYSNMVFMFLGFYYLFSYFRSRQRNEFYFSALLMAFAVFVRSETLIFIAMVMPFILYTSYRAGENRLRSVLHISLFMLICFIFYYVPGQIYNNHYLPQTYKVDNLMNKDLTNLDPLFERFSKMNSELIFGGRNIQLWGYYIYIFVALFLAELILKRKLTKEAANWLIATAVIYLGLPLLGFLFPLVNLDDTTKRGLFKLLPLLLLYMGNNQVLIAISERIKKWEGG